MAWRRSALLMLAMTLHNFPEEMAVGVGFGSRDLGSAMALAIGIGLQNIPEGLAIALPLRRGGMTRGRAFFWGQLSAAIEPMAGVIGAALPVAHVRPPLGGSKSDALIARELRKGETSWTLRDANGRPMWRMGGRRLGPAGANACTCRSLSRH